MNDSFSSTSEFWDQPDYAKGTPSLQDLQILHRDHSCPLPCADVFHHSDIDINGSFVIKLKFLL